MKIMIILYQSVFSWLQLGLQLIGYARFFVSAFFRSRASLGCELVALQSQLAFYTGRLQQKKEPRPKLTPAFRLLWVLLSKLWNGWRSAVQLMQPETVVKWHQLAFRQGWRWKSRRRGGRPAIPNEMRALIRRLNRENVLWSAERIHGHLVLLGLDPPCPDTIRKYMVQPKRKGHKSQSWLTFLRNHAKGSWGMDFFTVATIRFQILYVFVLLEHSRRQVVHCAVTAYPTTAWVVQQLREAMPFAVQPAYLLRDNDQVYGQEVSAFLAGSGIQERRTAYRSPWQNPFVERWIGTVRRELLDHVIVLNERHLRQLLQEFIEQYYHIRRPHQGLGADTPVPTETPRPLEDPARLISIPILGGLHHQYLRLIA